MPERPRSQRGVRQRRLARARLGETWAAFREASSNRIFASATLSVLALVLIGTMAIELTRSRVLPVAGRVANDTRAVRVDFDVPDPRATERAREAARLSAPRVYVQVDAPRRELEASLMALPTALASAETLEDVAQEIREAYQLTERQLRAVRDEADTERDAAQWQERVARLMASLQQRPMLTQQEFQLAFDDPASQLELVLNENETIRVAKVRALNIEGDLARDVRDMVSAAGFIGALREVVQQRLANEPEAMFVFNESATGDRRAEAAERVDPVRVMHREGEVLAQRGTVIDDAAHALIVEEARAYRESRSALQLGARWGAALGISTLVFGMYGLYMWLFGRDLMSLRRRIGALASILGVGVALSVWAAVMNPGAVWAAAIAPVLFTSMIVIIVLDARIGVVSAATQGTIVAAALGAPIGLLAATVAGAGVAGWRLRDLRSRNDVVRSAIWVGVAMLVACAVMALGARPLVPEVWIEIASDAALAGAAGFVACAFTLIVLPSMEKLFDVTTGMTLSELRDPKQPLLRQLQQKAPGTFNHSHTVATLAEAAADAIGADGLHVYVGALYHDIGKMNKPDYFVENQAPGFNRHEKLSPAMSLLVIVGHVKDGVEMAREYGLPQSLSRYIETHHGTTLVSYFYDRARKQAERDVDDDGPEEIEYRYPGPRPQTREQAILMLCDTVESATRAMPEPTPARIAALVREMANARLMDGQFDDCALTLSELRQIEAAVTKTLCSIYHGRIAYPKDEGEKTDTQQGGAPPAAQSAS